MNKPDAWMPLDIGDYLADTMHLSRDQHGAYLLLLMAYWRNQGPLADDDVMLAGIVRATAAEWRKLRPVMLQFFRLHDGHWHQKRADEEIAAARRRRDRAAAGGRAKGQSNSPQAPIEKRSNAAPLSGSGSGSESIDGDDARARDPKREVLEAIGVWDDDRWQGHGGLVDAWMAAGCDLDRDILPAVKAVMAKRGKQDPPSSLKYFDRPVMDALANRTTPPKPGKANGAQANRRDRPDRSAKLRESIARTFSDVAGGPRSD